MDEKLILPLTNFSFSIEKYLAMNVEEKRKLYKCGDDYQTLNDVLTWEDYMKEHRDKLLKKSKDIST